MIKVSTVFLDEFLSEGTAAGIVEFNNYATILSPMTVIKGPDDRNSLKQALPKSPGGGTGIGDGILKAIEVNELIASVFHVVALKAGVSQSQILI